MVEKGWERESDDVIAGIKAEGVRRFIVREEPGDYIKGNKVAIVSAIRNTNSTGQNHSTGKVSAT